RAGAWGIKVVRPCGEGVQQPVAAARVAQASARRAGESTVMRRRKLSRRRVWRLSKLTTQSVGTWSMAARSSSSDTRPRLVLVRAATTTLPIRSATGSRVRTSTGRSPPGVAANQTSPRCIGPVRPVFARAPVGDRLEGPLVVAQGRIGPGSGVPFAGQAQDLAAQGVAKEFGPVDAEPVGPGLRLGGDAVVDPEAQHRHTFILSGMTQRPAGDPGAAETAPVRSGGDGRGPRRR